MKKISLNNDWMFAQGSITMMDLFMENNDRIQRVNLPHDAMIYRERTKNTANAHQTGFYPGGEYMYIRQWDVPAEWEGNAVVLEFEGVADTCRIYLNGDLIAVNYNPYSGIFADVSALLKYGESNEIKVEVRSVEQSSRWYSGAGLYRPVSAWVGGQVYIPVNGVKVTTVEADSETAVVEIEIPVCNRGSVAKNVTLKAALVDADGKEVSSETLPIRVAAVSRVVAASGAISHCMVGTAEMGAGSEANGECSQRVRLTVDKPMLWSDETPYLYRCQITLNAPELSKVESYILEESNDAVQISHKDRELPKEQNETEAQTYEVCKGNVPVNNISNVNKRVLDEYQLFDSISIPFGIRTLRLNAKQGLLVNGVPVKLRGTCIHHDNGIIGAATFADAEYRRCRQLKEAGFNAIRSSHHPMSKEMLDACDRLGMYVMDELSDMWTRTKNPNDYANYFSHFWKHDLRLMVEKDYNHPSVILFSTGNEIPEAGAACGVEWNREINAEMKRLDPTRYTTSGINGLMAASDRMMEIICQASGMTPEQLAAMQQPAAGTEQQAATDGEKDEVQANQAGLDANHAGIDEDQAGADAGWKETQTKTGQAGADAVNGMALVMQGPLADAIAKSPILEEIIGEFASVTDIAGYNYLTGLHEEDHRRHPNRVVLGTETFPADIVNLWDIVKRNPHVLGDFTWTGYDYLGEAGCGIFHYDGGENFSAHWPDRLAGIGDIDILGDRKPISYLRQAVYGIGHEPYIAVLRMDKAGKTASKTPWMWKDNIASWTWSGYEGKMASVDVYANADEVELFLNGESFGRQAVAGTYVATYEVSYAPGELMAVSYIDGEEAGKHVLKTAGKATQLAVEIEYDCAKKEYNVKDAKKDCKAVEENYKVVENCKAIEDDCKSTEVDYCGTSKSEVVLEKEEGIFEVTEDVKLSADRESLVFIKIRLADAEGNFNPQEQAAITVNVESAEGSIVLQGFGSADPGCEGSYQDHTWNTYDGTVMAVLRTTENPGEAVVTVSADGFETVRKIVKSL